jgi:Methyltransferase domain
MGRTKKVSESKVEPVKLLKLDFGAGPHPREGFEGVDQFQFQGKVKYVFDVRKTPWPWADNSVEEAHASHFVEHLTGTERVKFCNELYRVLVPGGKCTIIVPHWASCRAYGDPTHQWPPVSEFWFYYLSREWRKNNAPHDDIEVNPDGFNCDFEATWGYSLRQEVLSYSQERQQFAMSNYKEVCQDTIATLTKKV